MSSKGIDVFTGIGFHTWQVKLRGYLMKKGLWGVVKPLVGEETIQTRARETNFKSRDEQALGVIITSLDDNHVHYVDEATTALDAWETLEKMFGAKAKHSKMSLKMAIYGLMMENGEDLASLVNRLKSLTTQLVYVQAPIEEEDQIAILLKALPDTYESIVTVLKEKEPIPSLSDIINSLQEYERKINGVKQDHGGALLSANHGAALATSRSSTLKKKCYSCGKLGHLSKDCFKAHPCTICGRNNHLTKDCFLKDTGQNIDKPSNSQYNANLMYESEGDEAS